ncbi:hypothetical protein ACIBBG_32230 [Micromonospora chersina]|uniref:hypothetical protein n=1 Tax=Micromonospora chersina TaxID=47854 RepID=UPI0037B84BD7
MVERITEAHKPVHIHGTGRIPDGREVPQPQPELAPPVTFAERLWAVMFVGVILTAIVAGQVMS